MRYILLLCGFTFFISSSVFASEITKGDKVCINEHILFAENAAMPIGIKRAICRGNQIFSVISRGFLARKRDDLALYRLDRGLWAPALENVTVIAGDSVLVLQDIDGHKYLFSINSRMLLRNTNPALPDYPVTEDLVVDDNYYLVSDSKPIFEHPAGKPVNRKKYTLHQYAAVARTADDSYSLSNGVKRIRVKCISPVASCKGWKGSKNTFWVNEIMLNGVQKSSLSTQLAYGLVTHMKTNIVKKCDEVLSEGQEEELLINFGLEKILKIELSNAAKHVSTSIHDKGTVVLATDITINQTFSVDEDGIDIIGKMRENLKVSAIEDRDCADPLKGSLNVIFDSNNPLYSKVTTLVFRAMGAPLIQEVDRNVFIIANRNWLDPDIKPLVYAFAYAPAEVLNFPSSAFGGSR